MEVVPQLVDVVDDGLFDPEKQALYESGHLPSAGINLGCDVTGSTESNYDAVSDTAPDLSRNRLVVGDKINGVGNTILRLD